MAAKDRRSPARRRAIVALRLEAATEHAHVFNMALIERLTAQVTAFRGALPAFAMPTPIARHPTRTFPQVVSELADKFGDAPALLSDREQMSYRELAERSNRYARWALQQDLRKGETVCLLMPGRP